MMIFNRFTIIFLFLFSSVNLFAQPGEFLGVNLRPEIRAIVKEIEMKAGEEIYAEFIRQKDFMLGSSFISEDGVPVVLVDFSLEDNQKKLEAVIAHELLHLRLRVNGYPTFRFSSNVNTAKGRAIDVEQGNINDLKDLIEHRIFKAEMEKLGLYKTINIAGDIASHARKSKGQEDGQDDSINYARAILEYLNPADTEEVRKIYAANGWQLAAFASNRQRNRRYYQRGKTANAERCRNRFSEMYLETLPAAASDLHIQIDG